MIKINFVFILILLISVTRLASQDTQTEAKIDSVLSQLTLNEKIAMVHAQSKFSSPGVPRLGIPELWMSDGPHGVRAELMWDSWAYAGWTNDSITAFPALTCLASTFNPELAYKYGKAIGEEARYRKKDVLLGPGVNIYRMPLNGRNFEYMGEDPFLASKMVVPYIEGVQKNGVAACVKHYALNNQELWRNHINVEISDRALHEIYLPAFKAAVQEAKVWAIMGAYNKFRGQYCCHNEFLINKILKKDWNFDGVVISDWAGTHDTYQAAMYGLDIEMGTKTDGLTQTIANAYDSYYLAEPLKERIEKGDISEKVLDDKVRRILRLMYRTNLNTDKPLGSINTFEHSNIARKIAQEGIVLLKNDDSIFPINPDKEMTIAVIGENATRSMTVGGGSSELKAKYEISPLEGIKHKFKNAKIIHSMGYASGKSMYGQVIDSKLNADSLVKEAIKTARNADIVLFVGGLNKSHQQDCENSDRNTYALPFGQEELIYELQNVNKNIGVILISGNAVSMPWASSVKGIIQGWYLGSESGNALADIISGDVNPSGKLPFTFPQKLEDNGAIHYGEMSYPGDSINQVYMEDIFVGYRWHDTKKITPMFAFGYGLSYADFTISDVTVNNKQFSSGDTITIKCTVTNNSNIEGAEVVQAYIGMPKSKIKRAEKELKAFEKVFLKNNETITIELNIPVNDLCYYNEKINDWSLEKGSYNVFIGNSSDSISEVIKIDIN